MHTAFEIGSAMFAVEVAGQASSREDLLQWEMRDRLGVVINSPFGALGAGLLILLSITAFYDVAATRRRRPLYPSIYLFHVGGPWGFHGEFDFWPDRKEIQAVSDPAEVLRAVNSHGITHLAVPDGTPREIRHRYKEPEEAIDRLKRSFAYSAVGLVRDSDVQLSTSAAAVLRNFDRTVHLAATLADAEQSPSDDPSLRRETPAGDDSRHYIASMRARLSEVSPTDAQVVRVTARVDRALAESKMVERLRRIDSRSAIGLLG